MRKLMFLIALSVIAAGQVKAGTCGSTTLNTLLGSSCTIAADGGTWTFFNFAYSSSTTVPAPPAMDLDISFITAGGAGGVGFEITPTTAWSANNGYTADGELQYAVTFNGPGGITSLYQSIAGTAVGTPGMTVGVNAFDNITDTYCPGVTSLPPSCSPGLTLPSNLWAGESSPQSNYATFAMVTGVGLTKDVSANATGYDATSASVTSFENCFDVAAGGTCGGTTPPTPEPGSLLMLGSGLLGLALLSVRRRRSLV